MGRGLQGAGECRRRWLCGWLRAVLFAAGAGVAGLPAAGGVPGAAGQTRVEQFKLPMYGEDGYKVWDVQGERLTVLGEGRLRIAGLVLQTYGGGAEIVLLHTITSPRAFVFPEVGLARGPGELGIEGESFSVTGKDWTWNGREKTITVKEEAVVVFRESLDDLFR